MPSAGRDGAISKMAQRHLRFPASDANPAAKQTESESLGAEIADVAGRCDDTNMPRGERMISKPH